MLPFTLSAKDSILAARNLQSVDFYQQNNNPKQVLTDKLTSLLSEQKNLCYMVFFCVLIVTFFKFFVLKNR